MQLYISNHELQRKRRVCVYWVYWCTGSKQEADPGLRSDRIILSSAHMKHAFRVCFCDAGAENMMQSLGKRTKGTQGKKRTSVKGGEGGGGGGEEQQQAGVPSEKKILTIRATESDKEKRESYIKHGIMKTKTINLHLINSHTLGGVQLRSSRSWCRCPSSAAVQRRHLNKKFIIKTCQKIHKLAPGPVILKRKRIFRA